MTTIQTVITDKLETLHDATQASVDATQAEARAAVDVIVTSIQSACPSARYIEFDLEEITGAVGFGRCYGDNGECEATDASRAFWYRTAGLIAADEFLTAGIEGLSLDRGVDHQWLLDLGRYTASREQ